MRIRQACVWTALGLVAVFATAACAHAAAPWVKKDHPYLFWEEKDLPSLRKKWNNPDFASYRAMILRSADDALNSRPGTNTDSNANTIAPLVFVYGMTGEAKYRKRLLAEAQAVSKTPVYKEGLHAMRAVWMAWAYDALFNELTDVEKALLRDYLEKWVEAKVDGWFARSPGNCCGVHLGGHGVAALALKDHPRAEGRVAALVRDFKRNFLGRGVRADGGWNEGAMYWDYGLTYYLLFAHALQNATGDDQGLLDHEAFKPMGDYVRTGLAGDGVFFSFNDSFPILTGGAIAADLGSRFNDPVLLWLADTITHKRQRYREGRAVWQRESFQPFLFLWRQEKRGYKDTPDLPTLSVLPVTQWGVLRSEATWNADLVVGVKGHKGELSHHKQHDMGTFELQASGERFLFDPGYHMPEANVHSVPLINGKGPAETGATITASDETRRLRWIAMDCTPAYGGAVKRLRRIWAMVDDDAVVLLDDIDPAGKQASVTMQLQCTQPPELDEAEPLAVLSGKQTRLVIQTYGPALSLQRRKLDVSRNREMYARWAKDGRIHPHTLTGDYTAAADHPLVTVFLPWPQGEKRKPKLAFRQQGDVIEIRFPKGKRVRFSRKKSGWHCAGR